MSRPSVFFDDVDELRNEFDWMYEFMGRMAERITNDPDVHNLSDYVQKLEDESAKLRELVRIAVRDCDSGTCDGCPILGEGESCPYSDMARELGIEV